MPHELIVRWVERPRVRVQDRNGVRVRVSEFDDGGTTVEADCQCFGGEKRVHSNPYCPLLARQRRRS